MHYSKEEFSHKVASLKDRISKESKKLDRGLQCVVVLQIGRELSRLIDEFMLLSSSYAKNN
jgi:hypothetical protein